MAFPNVSTDEAARRAIVIEAVRNFVLNNRLIRMNDPAFAGAVGEYSYYIEGEDDLLHLAVARNNEGPLSVEEAQGVLSFLAPDLPAGVVWVKPGTVSHHFYFAHDELIKSL